MKPRHTPGPWTIEESTYVFGHNNLRVADCECDGQTMSFREAKANAMLIAKAPNMYALLTQLANMTTEEEYGDDAPPSEDWICTLSSMIVEARKILNSKPKKG